MNKESNDGIHTDGYRYGYQLFFTEELRLEGDETTQSSVVSGKNIYTYNVQHTYIYTYIQYDKIHRKMWVVVTSGHKTHPQG